MGEQKKRILIGTVHYIGDEQGLVQWENGEVSREELPPMYVSFPSPSLTAMFDRITGVLMFCYSRR